MVKIGIIGFSEGNGHPYSFSAIINGYNKDELCKTKWTGILNYLQKRDDCELAALDAQVTHVWTQNQPLSEEIARSCLIPNVVNEYTDMLGSVDAVVIARDDFESHYPIAKVFLETGTPVFIDKPLTLELSELEWFSQFLENGLLMSCSGFRYAGELDHARHRLDEFGDVKLIRAAVINGWEKYGIHMIDTALGLKDFEPISVDCKHNGKYQQMLIEMACGTCLQVDTLGSDIVTFSFDIFGTEKISKSEVRDNFTAFKRTLYRFIEQVKTGTPAIPAGITVRSIKTLVAGKMSLNQQRKIELREL
ncbi:Gfo/Idh/MocA family protein [Pleionea sediminis]|uniref:Gfo/Idh/MocA family protein n=1 Tax=Pleionea sediminis TaxID=2569479 RepID=UPI0011861EDE|nr:Gfo/Idh/MocA family oxidoreductase [Pleionea sediminis]